MKTPFILRFLLLAACTSLLALSSASAQTTYFWDQNGDTAGTGGTGTWNISSNFWRSVSDTGTLGTWVNAGAAPYNDAVFGGTAGTVTLGQAISLRNLTINTASYIITGETLNFTSGNINITQASTIRSAITGSPTMTDGGASSSITYLNPTSGNMTLGAITRSVDKHLYLQGSSTSNNSIASIAKGHANAKLRVESGNWTFGNVYAGEFQITGGTLTLNGTLNNEYRSTKLLTGGTINYNNAGAIRDGSGTFGTTNNDFVLNGGVLDQTSGAAITTSTYNPDMDWVGNWTFKGSNGANSNLFLGNGRVNLNGGTRQVTVVNAATTLALGGVIQQVGGSGNGLTKAGAGTMELRGNSTYNGATTIGAGTLITSDTVASTTVLASSVTADATSDFITLTGNTLVDGNKVVFGGTTVPTGLTAGTVYFVRDTTGNTFKVSATSGGAAINLTGTGTAVTVTRPGVLGSTNSAIVLGNADTTTNNSSPTLLTSGAFTNERPITIANQATAGVYTIGGSNATGTATYTGAITLNRPLTLRSATGGTVNFQSAFITNNQAITIGSSGNTGIVRLSNAIATSGGINVNFGTLQLNSTFTGGNMTVALGATLSGTGSVAGTTGVTGATVNGTGLTLTDTTTFNSTGNILSGTLAATAGIGLASSAALENSATVTGGIAIGDGTLTGTGGSFSGASTLNGGIINLTSGSFGSTLGVTGGNWNGNGAVTGLITSSSGTFTIGNGANLTADGNVNVTGGTIAAGNSSSTITGSLNYTSSSNSTFAGIIAGSGKTLTMNSANTRLSLTGVHSYTGATNITAGTLEISETGSINSSSGISVASGAHFKYNSTTALTAPLTLSSGSTLSGSGTIGVDLALTS
ncbi:MAG: toxins and related Ca2+-binding domain, partial [Verrucomicrobiota bacterium]